MRRHQVALWALCLMVGVPSALAQSSTTADPSRTVFVPPLILREPAHEVTYVLHEMVELPCVASGEPNPRYSWLRNEEDFDPSGNDGRVVIRPGVGTLVFADPWEHDEAFYQCLATNAVGTALTVKVFFRQAILEQFPPGGHHNHQPRLGEAVTLRCTPPRSYPKAEIYWTLRDTVTGIDTIDLSDRVTLEREGSLHILNVRATDAKGGRMYVCNARNQRMLSVSPGAYQTIEPTGQTDTSHPPTLVYADPKSQIGIRGETWKVKCIFSGNPTPQVKWNRMNDKEMPEGRYRLDSFGQELVISNVKFEDAGAYECEGNNKESPTPVRRSFDLKVNSAPYWTQMPTSVEAAEGESAEFLCDGDAQPQANIYWFINGVPISQVPEDDRREVSATRVAYTNLTKFDPQVIQCNITNDYGYIFTNAYLNVVEEQAIITDPPEVTKRAAEGQEVNITCRVYGSPRPLVVWRKGNEQLTGGRFKFQTDGHLTILEVTLVDAGTYTCFAVNKYGNDTASGSLIVRRSTRIETPPQDVMVWEKTEAKFTCSATTDPEEVDSLKITWRKNDADIDRNMPRMFQNDLDHSLVITGAMPVDTGHFTCVASNGLDQDEASAQLFVQGVPNPPRIEKMDCYPDLKQARLYWMPGIENYAPILHFVIQYNTTFAPDSWVTIHSNVSSSIRDAQLELSPYANYTFRVLARNKIGFSQPSIPTQTVCRLLISERAVKNPENVIGEGDEPTNLIIYWTPMAQIDHNGADFYYVIKWRERDNPNAVERSEQINEWWKYHLVTDEAAQPYRAYDISVQAGNTNGVSSQLPATVIGYSGEDKPLAAPDDVMIDEESLTGTSVTLVWTHVNIDPDVVRGFFRGYRIEYWQMIDNQEAFLRQFDHIMNDSSPYPRPREKRQAPEAVEVTLNRLPPYSQVGLRVAVLNKYYSGIPSSPIYFSTPEAAPGPPKNFWVRVRGDTYFELEWIPPLEPNGILLGYNISYQIDMPALLDILNEVETNVPRQDMDEIVINEKSDYSHQSDASDSAPVDGMVSDHIPSAGPLQLQVRGVNLDQEQFRPGMEDPEQTRERLTGLKPDTKYRVYLSAVNAAGKSAPIFLDAITQTALPPSPPVFDVVEVGEDYVDVKWEPARTGNPGSVFYVAFRPRGEFDWLMSPDEELYYHMRILELQPGTDYQIRVVAKNGIGQEAPSEWLIVRTGGMAPGAIRLASAGWFYGIFAVLLILIIAMVLFMVLKRTRDRWWDEKEAKFETNVRDALAEEAVKAMGFDNDYPPKAASLEDLREFPQESLPSSTYKPSLSSMPLQQPYEEDEDEEESEDEDDSDEYDDEDEEDEEEVFKGGQPAPPVRFSQMEGMGYHAGMAPQSQPPVHLPPQPQRQAPSPHDPGMYQLDRPRDGASFI